MFLRLIKLLFKLLLKKNLFVPIIRKSIFEEEEAGGGGGEISRLYKLPTLRVRFGFCLFTYMFYFKTKNIIMCLDIQI